MALEPSTIWFIAYSSSMLLLMIILSVHAYTISHWNDTTSFLKTVKSMKSIYGAILVHIYDTSTDIAVLISWAILTRNEVSHTENYENVNMLSLFIPAVLAIFVYRVAFLIYCTMFIENSIFEFRCCSASSILILFDLYIFVLVYDQFKGRYITPCGMQKKLQTFESAFESMPQLILGSIFLIRTYGTSLAESGNIYIVFASMIGSLISIVNKFMDDDTLRVVESASRLNPSYKHCPCISISYLFVLLWRFCEIIVRFSIFTLLWSVINGMYLAIYFVLSFGIYYFLSRNMNLFGEKALKLAVLDTLQSVFGIVLTRKMPFIIIRFVDNLIMVVIIFVFATLKFECATCYDGTKRNYAQNPYIFVLITMAAACTILSFIIYLGLYFSQVITDKRLYSVKIAGLENGAGFTTQNELRYAQIFPKAAIMIHAKAHQNRGNKEINDIDFRHS
eukprot:1125035_1